MLCKIPRHDTKNRTSMQKNRATMQKKPRHAVLQTALHCVTNRATLCSKPSYAEKHIAIRVTHSNETRYVTLSMCDDRHDVSYNVRFAASPACVTDSARRTCQCDWQLNGQMTHALILLLLLLP